MRTVHLTQDQFRWSELDDKAKDYVRNTYFSDYAWADDAMASLKAFAEHFGSRLKGWSIDWGGNSYSSARFESVELEPEELARLVGELKHDGSCQFTGYCSDDDCNEGAVKAYAAGERDVMAILEAGFDYWLKAAQGDHAGSLEDAEMAETCEANDYWFDKHGSIV